MADEAATDRIQSWLALLESATASGKLLQLSLDFLVDTVSVNYQDSLSSLIDEFRLSGADLKALAPAVLILYDEANDFLLKRNGAIIGLDREWWRKAYRKSHEFALGCQEVDEMVSNGDGDLFEKDFVENQIDH